MRRFRRVLVFTYCTVLAFVILHVASDEAKRRSEMIALCDYAALGAREPKLSKPAPAAEATVRWIAAAAGVAPNFEVYEGDEVPNIAFAGVKGGKRIIVYDAKRFAWGEKSARWTDVCILAHEVGHHLGTHLFLMPEPHDAETEADHYAGWACALMGASLTQALVMTDLFSEEDSESHPGEDKRRAVITEGWTRGNVLKRTGKLTASGDAAP